MDYAHSHLDSPYVAVPPRARRLEPAPPPPAALTRDEAWALVAPHRARLIEVARERGLSLPDAQDVAHHVMCRAVERGTLDPDRVEASLVKAAVTRCQDVREDAARQAAMLERTRSDDRLVGELDDAVCDRAHARWLLGRLPDRERRVIALSVAGETVTGIAAATGLSYPTVDRLLSRARKEMRRIGASCGVAFGALWRHRRVSAAPVATAAVAVASVGVLSLHAVAPREARVVVRPAISASAASQVRRATHRAPVRHVAAARAVAAAPPAVPAGTALARTAPVPGVASVRAPVSATRGSESLQARLRKCLENGVSIELSSRGRAACAEHVSVTTDNLLPGRT